MYGNEGSVRPVSLNDLGQHYRRYRLTDAAAEEAMAGSLRRWGPLAPVVACVRQERLEVVDGFKRLAAARQIPWTSLSVLVLAVDDRAAKAAILGLNRGQRATRELEEEDLRLGLLGPALARQLTRLPAGNQAALLAVTRRETLTAQETSGVIGLLEGASEEQAAFVLAKPREALKRAQGVPRALRDPRLSQAGNWLASHLTRTLESLLGMENWLRTPNERELRARDREILQPLLDRLGDQASVVAELVLGPDFDHHEPAG